MTDATIGIPKLLLLSCTPPVPDGVGGIILSDLIALLPTSRASVAVLSPDLAPTCEELVQGVPLRRFHAPYKTGLSSRFGAAGKSLKWLSQMLANWKALARARKECVSWAREQGIGQVWAVLDAPASIELAAAVAGDLGVPLRLTIWDDIAHNVRHFGVDRLTARKLSRQFDRVMRSAVAHAVIGESMRADYRTTYGVESTILRHGLPPGQQNAHSAAGSRADRLVIGYAGSVSGRSAFEALLEMLDSRGWCIRGREVVLRLMGRRYILDSTSSRRIEYLGWQPSTEATLALLSQCDIAYLPQPFEAEWAPFSRLSFPTKLTTYLVAGLPVLLHAPVGASLPMFFQRYPVGAWCDSLEHESLVAAIHRLGDDRFLADCALARRSAIEDEFGRDVFRQRFAQFLGIAPSALAA